MGDLCCDSVNILLNNQILKVDTKRLEQTNLKINKWVPLCGRQDESHWTEGGYFYQNVNVKSITVINIQTGQHRFSELPLF